jgi:hypothetical protein
MLQGDAEKKAKELESKKTLQKQATETARNVALTYNAAHAKKDPSFYTDHVDSKWEQKRPEGESSS